MSQRGDPEDWPGALLGRTTIGRIILVWMRTTITVKSQNDEKKREPKKRVWIKTRILIAVIRAVRSQLAFMQYRYQHISLKGQIINSLGFVGHAV